MTTQLDDLKFWLSKVDEKLDGLTDDVSAIKADVAVIKAHAENRDDRIRALEAAQKNELTDKLEKPRKLGWLAIAAVITFAVSIMTSCVSSWIAFGHPQKSVNSLISGGTK